VPWGSWLENIDCLVRSATRQCCLFVFDIFLLVHKNGT
jgi:hypothetical protein